MMFHTALEASLDDPISNADPFEFGGGIGQSGPTLLVSARVPGIVSA
jgi:hypothetical protein